MRRWEETPKRAWGAQWFLGNDHGAMALVADVLPRTQEEGAAGWLTAATDLLL